MSKSTATQSAPPADDRARTSIWLRRQDREIIARILATHGELDNDADAIRLALHEWSERNPQPNP